VLGAHLLATVREAWAVAPAVREVNVVGQRVADGRAGYLFSVTLGRDEFGWDDDTLGRRLLECGPKPLRVAGASREMQLWPFDVPAAEAPTTPAPAPTNESRPQSSAKQRMTGEQIVACRNAPDAPAWVGRQGGAAGVQRDVGSGLWREWRYEVRADVPRSLRNWMPVDEFLAIVTTSGV
jgi:hypothetical protein